MTGKMSQSRGSQLAALVVALALSACGGSASTQGVGSVSEPGPPATSPTAVAVPDVVGFTQATAIERLEAVGLRARVLHGGSAGYIEGQVYWQSPAGGSTTTADTVTIRVADAPSPSPAAESYETEPAESPTPTTAPTSATPQPAPPPPAPAVGEWSGTFRVDSTFGGQMYEDAFTDCSGLSQSYQIQVLNADGGIEALAVFGPGTYTREDNERAAHIRCEYPYRVSVEVSHVYTFVLTTRQGEELERRTIGHDQLSQQGAPAFYTQNFWYV